MTAIENVLNQDVGLTSTPEEINRYYAVSFGAYAAKPVFAFTSDYALGKGRQRYRRRAKLRAAVLFFSGRVHVWAVLREDAETSVRVWDFDDGMREWSVRERRRDIGVAFKGGEYKDEGRSLRRDAAIGDQNTTR